MKNLLVAIVLVGITTIGFAQEKPSKFTTVEIEVDGLCEMCKDRIEEASNMSKGVKESTWNIETHMLAVTYRTDKTTPEEIAKNIAKVGHDSQYQTATPTEYAKVHKCCMYRTGESH